MKKAGNHLVKILGGRPIHPVSVRVGGCSRVPRRRELEEHRPALDEGLGLAQETVKLVGRLHDAGVRPRAAVRLRSATPPSTRSTTGGSSRSDGIDLAAVGLARRLRGASRSRARTPSTPARSTARAPTSWARRRASCSPPTSSTRWRRRRSPPSGFAELIRTNIYASIVGPGRGARPRLRRGARHHRRLPAAGRAAGAVAEPAGRRRLGDGGAARPPVPPLRGGRGGPDPAGPDRPAHEPEPGRHRGGPRRGAAKAVLDLPHDAGDASASSR